MNKTIKFTVLSFVLLFLIDTDILGQIDKRFWFVIPETTRDHQWVSPANPGDHYGKEPGVIRITTFENAANVTISMPANPDFEPIVFNNIPANSQVKHEFWDAVVVESGSVVYNKMLWTVENGTMDAVSGNGYNLPNDWQGWTAGTPFNKGILIESDQYISAYYEVANSLNPERFNLKGNNALGTEFLIPSQNRYENRHNSSREKIDIVATEDNTVVTVQLTNDHNIQGHAAGSTFNITLNKGQTYSLRSTSGAAARHLGGTYITSNHPIAITISDDSIRHPGQGNNDLVGDQIVPVNGLGTRYIAMHTSWGHSSSFGATHPRRIEYTSTAQHVFIWNATDATNNVISIDTIPTATLNGRGDFIEVLIEDPNPLNPIVRNAILIESEFPIIVYQFASFGYELGSAILPPIDCTGSREVTFQKVNDADFLVQILTQHQNIENLEMVDKEGNGVDISSIQWNIVAATEKAGEKETWYTGVINFRRNTISTTDPYTVRLKPGTSPNGMFHLSILDANGNSMSYGYFSSYSSLYVDGLTSSCVGNEVTLTALPNVTHLNPDAISLYWYSETDNETLFHSNSITVTESDRYFVRMAFPGCETTNYIDVDFSIPDFDLGEDQSLCPGEELSFEFDQFTNNETFQWTVNGDDFGTDNNFNLIVDASTVYEISLTITDAQGCTDTKEVTVTGLPAPVIDWNIGDTNDICLGDEIRNLSTNHRYQWTFEGGVISEDNYIEPTESGQYGLTVWTDQDCVDSHTREITVNPLPVVTLEDDEACYGETGTFSVDGAIYETIRWYNNETGNSITLNESVPEVSVTVTNEYGCEATATAEFTVHNQVPFDYEDIRICSGPGFDIEVDESIFSNIVWQFNSEPPYTTDPENINSFLGELDEEGTYTITAVDNNGCHVSSSFNVEIFIGNPPLEIENFNPHAEDGFMCSMDTIRITTPGHLFSSYKWSFRDSSDPEFQEIGDDPYVIATVPGIYRLEATETFGCRNEAEIEIELYPQPEFDLFDAKLCPGNEEFQFEIDWLYVDGLDIMSVQWLHDPDEVATSITVSNIGTYTVTAWDERGCFRTESAAAEYYPVQDIDLTDIEFCDNESRIISLSDVVNTSEIQNHIWNWASGTTNDNDLIITEPGEYTLIIEDNNLHFNEDWEEVGCFTTITFTATMNPSPNFSLGADRAVCIGESITIEVDDSYTRYEWNGSDADDQPAFYDLTTPGEDNVSLQVWNEHGCTSTHDINVDVIPLPEVSLPSVPTVCAGEKIELSIPHSPEDYTIVWITPTGIRHNTSSITTTAEGIYQVRVIDEHGCRSEYTETYINKFSMPTAYFHPDDVNYLCPVELPIQLNLNVNSEYSYEIKWHDDLFDNQATRDANIGLYIAYITDENDCRSMKSHSIYPALRNQYQVGDTIEVCDPEIVVLDGGEYTIEEQTIGYGMAPILEWNWYLNEVSEASRIQFDEATEVGDGHRQTLQVFESGNYIVEVFDGCHTYTDTFQVSYYPSPIIAGLDTMFYAQVTAFVEGGTMPYSYTLNDGMPQTNHTFKDVPNGEHIIWVEDAHGCETFTVFNLDSNYDIEIPNFFTPNGDGINDDWIIEGLERLPESIVYIYNRYGKLLRKFSAADQPWDGTYLNRPLPSDDYWYVIHLLPVDKYLRGNVTLIR
ncbi:T9SS type B sorting domain-containing protein [Alkalitalea saponilacus]|uniref:Gliding motility-associated C-terminal domain-containing protein n=1 Tax=Alkalitalea saponilacus TaxID=889453 RepID=A0A1T5EWF7_9BACT|nr:T9SS type B sorting domain-containing protein [Alkalitalea saponilacus]ASB47994.1 hypothetical protein CDL62_01905 [Alkalitalea saponilacus]SKB88236.1 gliding motility-associated C-terminal domain-containing protein [Alkalitalea saponilacus]